MAENRCLLSVIVPIYNVEKFLPKCLDSILNQTYKNLEIILVDDGSTDCSAEICDEYEKKDSRIKLLHQENRGVGIARNVGLDYANGKYITFVDSDDYIRPQMYEKMMDCIRNKQVDICMCMFRYEDELGNEVLRKEQIHPQIYGKKIGEEFAESLYLGRYENMMVISMCNKIFHRKVFELDRFLEIPYAEDDEIISRIINRGHSIYILEDMYYVYVKNSKSLVQSVFSEYRMNDLDAYEKRCICFENYPYALIRTKRMYCRTYLNCWFLAKKNCVKFPEEKRKIFMQYLNELYKEKSCDYKFYLEMYIFAISPRLYKLFMKVRSMRAKYINYKQEGGISRERMDNAKSRRIGSSGNKNWR